MSDFLKSLVSSDLTPARGPKGKDFVTPVGRELRTGPTREEIDAATPERGVGGAIADTLLGAGAGVVTGIKTLTDTFGADNRLSESLGDATKALYDNQSDQRKVQRQQRAKTIEQAEKYGSALDEISANIGGFLEAPVETTVNALGTSAPTLLMSAIPGLGQAGAARLILQGATGAAQGMGAAKGSIYEAVSNELVKTGQYTKEEADKVAAGAQAYDSKNAGNIAINGLIGLIAGTSGIESFASRIAGRQAGQETARGIAGRAGMGVLKESPVEGTQGGFERYTSNVALNNEGFKVDPMQGVAGQAAGEAIASAPGGAVLGALDRGTAAPFVAPPADPVTNPLQPVVDQAQKPGSVLSRAVVSTGMADQPAAPADPIAARVAAIEEDLRANGTLEKIRGFGPETSSEFLYALNAAKNPNTRPDMREQAIAQVEQVLQTAQSGQGFTMVPPEKQEPSTALTVPGQPGGDLMAQQGGPLAPNGMGGFFDPNIVDVDAVRVDNMLPGPRAIEGPRARIGTDVSTEPQNIDTSGQSVDPVNTSAAAPAADSFVPGEQQNVAPATETPAAPAIPEVKPGAGGTYAGDPSLPAATRKRAATLRQLADQGYETVERRGNEFFLKNSKTGQELKLEGMADSQLARNQIRLAIDAKANTAAASPLNDRTEPTEAQIAAGNYKKSDVIDLNGMKIKIENPKDSIRRGTSPDGVMWETKMAHHYGEFQGTEGADGDKLDVFVGPRPDSAKVYVIDQVNEDGSFDEHKVMMGFTSEEAARAGYLANYEKGWTGLGAITEMPVSEFKTWAKSRAAKKPAGKLPKKAAAKQDGKPTRAEIEAKADEVMAAMDEIGETSIGREKVVSLIENKGLAAADEIIKAFRDKAAETRAAAESKRAASNTAPKGEFATLEEAKQYLSQQRRAGGAVSGLPLELDDGSFTIAVKGSKEYKQAEKQRDERDNADIFSIRDGGKLRKLKKVKRSDLPKGSPPRTPGEPHPLSQEEAMLIEQVAAVLGKEVIFFKALDGRVGDGFFLPSKPNVLHVATETTVNPLAVFGHEFYHDLRESNPEAWEAIAFVVRSRVVDAKGFRGDYYGAFPVVDAKGQEVFGFRSREAAEAYLARNKGKGLKIVERPDYVLGDQPGGELEELISDLGGNLMMDADFWRDVFAKIQEDHGTEAKGIIARLAAALTNLIGRMVGVMKLDGYVANNFVTDVGEINKAFRDALADHIKANGITKMSMGAEIKREEQNIRKSMAGRGARTADKYNLDMAEQMLANGNDPELVRQQTGWFKGKDGKWRFEISDANAKFVDAPKLKAWLLGEKPGRKGLNAADARELKKLKPQAEDLRDQLFDIPVADRQSAEFDVLFEKYTSVNDRVKQLEGRSEGKFERLGDVLDHPALFAAYPEIANYTVTLRVDPTRKSRADGFFNQDQQHIYLETQDFESMLDSLLHEVQHGIQSVEGFAMGGSVKTGDASLPAEVVAQIKQLNEAADAASLKAEFSEARRLRGESDKLRAAAGFEQYQRLAGEVESRNVERRRKMTAAERQATPPSATADVPDSDVIVMFNGEEMKNAPMPANAGEARMSRQRAFHGTPHRGIEKFDTAKIGTGEGNQAYGWGLYFASRKDIAEWYRRSLSKTTPAHNTFDGKRITKKLLEQLQQDKDNAVSGFFRSRAGGRAAGITNIAKAVDDAIETAQENRDDFQQRLDNYLANPPFASTYKPEDYRRFIAGYESQIAGLEALKSRLGFNKEQKGGQLYEVEIPGDEEMLLWDKPLSEQTNEVIDALRLPNDPDWRLEGNPGWGKLTGEEFYQALQGRIGLKQRGDKAASEYLSNLGIKGIKYLDGTSRGAGDGSYNYVIFDGEEIAIQQAYYSRDRSASEYAEVENRYKGTDEWMRAPDGTPTILTERQWVQVRTPSFLAWFGDWTKGDVWSRDDVSKAVGKNGEPLVVYHGTDKGGFTEFEEPTGKGRGDLGIWTTPDYGMASSYVRKGRAKNVNFSTPDKSELEDAGYEFIDLTDDDVAPGYYYNDVAGDENGPFATEQDAVNDAATSFEGEPGTQPGIYALFINIRNPNEDNFEGANWSGERVGQYQVMNQDGELQYTPEGKAYFDMFDDANEFAKTIEGGEVQPADSHYKNTDDVASEALRNGNDGAIIRQVMDDGGGVGYWGDPQDIFVAFRPTQVKSADFNGGEFSDSTADLRKSTDRKGKEKPQLMSALHNISAEGLLNADRMGGLAVPSIAVVKDDMGMSNFGTITLIGGQKLADPDRNPAYSSDAYSPRWPSAEYRKVKWEAVKPLMDELKPFELQFENSTPSEYLNQYAYLKADPDRVVSEWIRSNATKAMYLSEKGIKTKPIMQPVNPRVGFGHKPAWVSFAKKADWSNLYGSAAPEDRDAFIKEASKAAMAAVEEYVNDKNDGEASEQLKKYLREGFIDNYFSKDGELGFGYLSQLADDAKTAGKKRVSNLPTSEMLDKKIGKKLEDFKSWVEKKVVPLYGDPFLTLGGRKVPYTIDNIADAMTGTVVGKEKTMTFGAGMARAAAATRFSSLNHMRNATWQMADRKSYEAAKEVTEKLLSDFRPKVAEYYANGSSWNAMDDAMRAIMTVMKRNNFTPAGMRSALTSAGFRSSSIPGDVINLGVDAARALFNAPVPYFEAKPQRVVSLDEFAGAVIPKGTSQAVKDVLQKHGITTKTYDRNDEGDRERVTIALRKSLAKKGKDVLFSRDRGVQPADLTELRQRLDAAPPMTSKALQAIRALRSAIAADAQAAIDAGEAAVYVYKNNDNGTTKVLTPSAQKPGQYQLTRYGKTGAFGDSQYPSIEAAIADNGMQFMDRLPLAEAEARMNQMMEAEAAYQDRKLTPQNDRGEAGSDEVRLEMVDDSQNEPANYNQRIAALKDLITCLKK